MDAVFLLMELLRILNFGKSVALSMILHTGRVVPKRIGSRQTSLLKHVLKKKQVIPLLRI
jgi:hypothetical protein